MIHLAHALAQHDFFCDSGGCLMTAAVASSVFAPLLHVVSPIFFPPESFCDLFLPHLCEESSFHCDHELFWL